MVRVCKECKSTMHKVSSVMSGNARFETWQCDKCMHRKRSCVGLE